MTNLVHFDASVPKNGYRWWYLDALSDDGQHGLAIIGFVGSVFSPYYVAARKRGEGDPEDHCAINVGLYGKVGHRWAMTERGRRHLSRTPERFRIGPSSMAWENGTLIIRIDEITVPFPTRIRGEVRLTPRIVSTAEIPLDPDQHHFWRPVAPVADVKVLLEKPGLSWHGTGYHDMNWGERPLEADFSSWVWSRTALRDGARIVYDRVLKNGSRSGFALRIGSDGVPHEIAVPKPVELGRGLWRMDRPAHADGPVNRIMSLEDAPFYTRSLFRTAIDGEEAAVFHESLSLDRFTHPFILRMLPFRMPRRS